MININQKNLKGIIPILYTFFNKNNSIDIELMKDQNEIRQIVKELREILEKNEEN